MKKVEILRIKDATAEKNLLIVFRNIIESPSEHRLPFLLREKQQEILSKGGFPDVSDGKESTCNMRSGKKLCYYC